MADEYKSDFGITNDGKETEYKAVKASEFNSADEPLNTEEPKETPAAPESKHIPYDRFKAKVDEANALKDKLAKIEDEQKEAKRKELEEAEEFKELYEQAQEEIKQQKEDALNAKKDLLLVQAGYSEDQTDLLRKLVDGESDEEMTKSIENLKATFPAKSDSVDPSPMNGHKDKIDSKGGEGFGKTLYQRVMGK